MSINYLNLKEEFRYICFDVERPFLTNLIIDMLEYDPEHHRVSDPLSKFTADFHNELIGTLVSSTVALERAAQAASAEQELPYLKEAVHKSMQARALLHQGGFTDQAKTAEAISRKLRRRYALLEERLRHGNAPSSPNNPPTSGHDPAP